MVKAVNAALVSACARSAGAIYRIHDAKGFPDLMAPTVRRELTNVLACSAATFFSTQALKTDFAKAFIPKIIRKSLIVQGLATIGPAILSEAFSRRLTGFNMTDLIAREIAKSKAADEAKRLESDKTDAPRKSSLMQFLSRAKFGDGYPVGFQAITTERLATASTANPFSQGMGAALRFNGCQSYLY